MARKVATPLPEGVYSDGEYLWRATPGATSTFEENLAARELFMDLHRDEFWNPWRMEEKAEELTHAQEVMEEWERAEPGFRQMTLEEWEARSAERDREHEAKAAREKEARELNRQRYNPEREEARLALLEVQCILANKRSALEGLRSGKSFPAMDSKRRTELMDECSKEIKRHESENARLVPIVGDPEDVPDAAGKSPRDRRSWMLYLYGKRRIDEVRKLQAEIPELDAQMAITPKDERAARSKLRSERSSKTWRLDKLLAIPRQEAEDMCADCACPTALHGYTTPPSDGPCPAWPGQRAIQAQVMEMLKTFQRSTEAKKAAAPKPQPLAVLPSGLPINEAVERLQQLQQEFPDAEVRRGRANRFELWPRKNPEA